MDAEQLAQHIKDNLLSMNNIAGDSADQSRVGREQTSGETESGVPS
jgi:hypothetical protein